MQGSVDCGAVWVTVALAAVCVRKCIGMTCDTCCCVWSCEACRPHTDRVFYTPPIGGCIHPVHVPDQHYTTLVTVCGGMVFVGVACCAMSAVEGGLVPVAIRDHSCATLQIGV
jgi:hypothetical protein